MDIQPWRLRAASIILLTIIGCGLTTGLLFALFMLSQSFLFWAVCITAATVWMSLPENMAAQFGRQAQPAQGQESPLRVRARRLP
jgi:hypothetical protein